jgi:hypothetical protein
LSRFRHRQNAHSKLFRQLAPRHGSTQRQLAAQDQLLDRMISLVGETGTGPGGDLA